MRSSRPGGRCGASLPCAPPPTSCSARQPCGSLVAQPPNRHSRWTEGRGCPGTQRRTLPRSFSKWARARGRQAAGRRLKQRRAAEAGRLLESSYYATAECNHPKHVNYSPKHSRPCLMAIPAGPSLAKRCHGGTVHVLAFPISGRPVLQQPDCVAIASRSLRQC
jgi:hypothetical protein